MIYGITGLPGNGKTLYAISWIKAKAEKEGRPVFYAGIKGLTLPWTEIDPLKWFDCPANSIVVIDECQRFFGVRARGSTVPPHAQQLETHRHLGIDLVLITQSPMLLDNHDRSLIGTHFHVVRNFGLNRATVYEFQQCKDNVLKSRGDGIRHEWRYPKEAFTWYQSAEVHTHKARIPMRVWLLLLLPLFLGFLIWYIYGRWSARAAADDVPPPVGAPAVSGQVYASSPRQVSGGAKDAPMTAVEYAAAYNPRIDGLHYTAPAYDEVTKPVVAPYPAAVVVSKSKGCRAYSQQGTRLEMPDAICRQIAEGGFFMAWQQPTPQQESPKPVASLEEAPPGPSVTIIGSPRLDMPPGQSPRYDGFVEQTPSRSTLSRPSVRQAGA